MVGPHIDEASIPRRFVNPIWVGTRNFGVWEIVAVYFLGRAFPGPLCPAIHVVADEFLLLGVYGNDRLGRAHLPRDAGVDVLELRVAVGMLIPLDRLAVALEAVAHSAQKNSHHAAAGAVAQTFQCLGKTTRALAGPAQWRHGIAARQWLDKALQFPRQVGLMLNG